MTKKLKRILFLILGTGLIIYGTYQFYFSETLQLVVLGFAFSSFGAIFIGWNLKK